ncbi:hypothetical protein [Caballeronia sp. LZ035]|uniref:hypothetical protein n=1 Tax=Caballeronia sp. LZ035 TaxID=3038568 RepID=UPI00286679C8|nr:hypothetical protein [Caballeronia sp. LZ035]MDR5761745.1 hypothetical protein [Caballeronia sp. LZ035]
MHATHPHPRQRDSLILVRHLPVCGPPDKDLTLATRIEGRRSLASRGEDGPLDGTPSDDQRFRYIKYDQARMRSITVNGSRRVKRISPSIPVASLELLSASPGVSTPGEAEEAAWSAVRHPIQEKL